MEATVGFIVSLVACVFGIWNLRPIGIDNSINRYADIHQNSLHDYRRHKPVHFHIKSQIKQTS